MSKTTAKKTAAKKNSPIDQLALAAADALEHEAVSLAESAQSMRRLQDENTSFLRRTSRYVGNAVKIHDPMLNTVTKAVAVGSGLGLLGGAVGLGIMYGLTKLAGDEA